jgi:sugar phosphate isomerase/epimerase
MQIFASTTSLGHGRTDLADILPAIVDLGFDGIELGSTHVWRSDLAGIIENNRPARILTHNYFPPSPDELVINIASSDANVRAASIAHVRTCIDFAASVGAELYTVHPGFMAATATAATRRTPGVAFDFDFVGTRTPYEQSFALMRDALGDLLRCAQAAGVRLAIETEGSITKPGMLLMEHPKEYRRLFSELGPGLLLNFNLAHSSLAAKHHGFDLTEFICEFGHCFAAVEISHNDGEQDHHKPLIEGSFVFKWLPLLPDVPLILEFREASARDLQSSAKMLLSMAASFQPAENCQRLNSQ